MVLFFQEKNIEKQEERTCFKHFSRSFIGVRVCACVFVCVTVRLLDTQYIYLYTFFFLSFFIALCLFRFSSFHFLFFSVHRCLYILVKWAKWWAMTPFSLQMLHYSLYFSLLHIEIDKKLKQINMPRTEHMPRHRRYCCGKWHASQENDSFARMTERNRCRRNIIIIIIIAYLPNLCECMAKITFWVSSKWR